ncbi:MAG: S41 family peptidase [Bacteroidales bacterium]
MRKLSIQIAALMIFLIPFTGLSQNGNNFEISKNLDIYTTLFKELNSNYVDDIKPGELMETGIEAMLESLDPYTVYIPESSVEDYKLITTGQYGGIGSLIHSRDDYVVISEPYEGYPAQNSGLKAGDRILEIDGKSAKGKSSSEVSEILKGQPGSSVSLTVQRPGMDEPLTFEIDREKIKIDNIPWYGMVNDHIGYIKLTGFTKNAGNDVRKAFLDLKKNNDLQGLILDLRGNGGGLLNEAVNVTNIFVDKGKTVVSTKGKLADKNREHKTRFSPVDKNIPLAVLVNETSASAAEIVAGALQDMDRAVIIGQRTFGKGLVQNVIPLSYNAQAKITVAKYYIPSGRCIQAIDYSHKNENGLFTKIPDSLTNEYKTASGRRVYDGGGIEPDVFLDPRKLSDIAASLMSKFLVFDYATKYTTEHDSIENPQNFEITEDILRDFKAYISDKDYDYTTKSEKKLEELKKVASKDNYFEAVKDEYAQLKMAMMHNKEEDLITFEDQIKDLLRMEIASRYYYQKGKVISSLKNDPEVEKAAALLENTDDYTSILDGSFEADAEKEKG